MMVSLHIYHPSRSLSRKQQDAVFVAWATLSVCAEIEARGGHKQMARHYAERARGLVAAFGVRWDGKRKARRVQS